MSPRSSHEKITPDYPADANQSGITTGVIIMPKDYKSRPKYVYFIQLQNEENLIKIGQSRRVLKRINELRYSHKDHIEVLLITKSRTYGKITEKHLHKLFREFQVNSEWFKPDKLIFKYIKKIKNLNLAEDAHSICKDEMRFGGLL